MTNHNVSLAAVSDVAVPSVMAMNLSIDGYFLPRGVMETEQHLLDFLNGVLDGSVQVSPGGGRQRRTSSVDHLINSVFLLSQCQGGNSFQQRIRRFVFDIKVTLTVSPSPVPVPSQSRPSLCRQCPVSVTGPLSVRPSSRCSTRLLCWAASWLASRWPLLASSATCAAGRRPA